MLGNLPGLARQRQRSPLGDHRGEPIPTRLDDHVSMTPGHERGPQADGQVGVPDLTVGGSVLPHPRVHEDPVP